MDYKELICKITSAEAHHADLLIAALAEINFDTFEETEDGFKAYIIEDAFDLNLLESALAPYRDDIVFSFEINHVVQQNWNQVWESNFEPIEIKDQVYVRATFHPSKPDFRYEIVIDPKMAFGTGHHQTTAMIMEYLLETDIAGKNILDMGCGTGILAILAAKLEAASIIAIDNDPICYESTVENAAQNHAQQIKAFCGSKENIPNEKFDFILANINRNILLDQMERYGEVLKNDGSIFFSGFYEDPDLGMIKEAASRYGMEYVNHKKKDLWVAAKFTKIKAS